MATHMETTTPGAFPTRHGMSRYEQRRKRSIGALVAGVSLATAMTVGSGLSGVLPGLSTKARAATTLKGLVYIDLNQNGTQDVTTDPGTNEPGYSNVTVTAYAKSGAVAGTTATGANGTWQIVTDAAGPYRVEFSNYATTQIASGPRNGGTSVQFPTGANPINFTLFGKVNGLGELNDLAFESLEIGNFVWNDTNNNGVQDPEEPGIPGVAVNLVDEAGNPAVNVNTGEVLPTQVTNSAGEYYFTSLGGPREYRVVIDATQAALTGRSLTTQFSRTSGGNAQNDSNGFYVTAGSPETGLSTPISVGSIVGVAKTAGPGQNDHTFDFGFVNSVSNPKYSLGDYVFIDTNRNGIQDTGDTPVAGAKAELLDGNGAAVANQPAITTGADGKYLFTGLDLGSYKVRFTRPSGSNVVPTTANTGTDDELDSDTVAENTESAITGVISLTASVLNVDSGWVTPTEPVKGKIGDYVFIDTNRNGLQDNDEPGVGGVRVALETCQGAEIFSQATLDSGLYEFSGLDAGQYQIRFTLPNGYDFTVKNAGSNPAIDSDADLVTGTSGCVTLAQGETNLSVDAGLVAKTTSTTTTIPTVTTTTIPTVTTTTIPTVTTTTIPTVTTTTIPTVTTTTTPVTQPAKIGDRLFIDTNRNGVQDPTETGVVGARVNLETCAGAAITSTLTIADGRYEFANLTPGTYRVRFELPAGYDFTARGIGSDRGLDSDADQATGVTGCVTLVAGQFDPTVDAGVVEKAVVTTTTTPVTTTTAVIILTPTTTTTPPTTTPVTTTPVVVPTGCIGDKVFEGKAGDKDGKGIPGITLVLITPEGTSLSTTTDANGFYKFCTLKPGIYTVRVTVPPANATNIYTLDGKNNNATTAKLDAGKDNLDADFGYDLKNVQVLPSTVEQGPDFPETPVITPSVTGSNGTRQALAALAMILTGVGLVGLLRSRKERWQ